MTPHVVRNPQDAAKLRAETEARLGKSAKEMIPVAPAPLPTTPKP